MIDNIIISKGRFAVKVLNELQSILAVEVYRGLEVIVLIQ